MRKPKKPTRQQLLRALVYRHIREYIAATITSATAVYDSQQYRSATWADTYEWCVVHGALEAGRELGVVTGHLELRVRRAREACSKRWQKLHAEKYPERTS